MIRALTALLVMSSVTAAAAQHGQMQHHTMTMADSDKRQMVDYPDSLRQHTLASMRDHLVTLQNLQRLLAEGQFDAAANLAEQRLGLSSFGLHNAAQSAPFMPEGMRNAGTEMHRSASRFARIATDSSVTGDLAPPLKALAELTARCVACHAGYRLR